MVSINDCVNVKIKKKNSKKEVIEDSESVFTHENGKRERG